MALVEQDFIDEFIRSYEILFENDPGEYEVFCDHSASMRRVFSRWKRPFVVIGRDGEFYNVLPKGAGMKKIKEKDLPKHEPFNSDKAFAKAVRSEEHTSELQSHHDLVCRLLLEKKKKQQQQQQTRL